MISAIPHAIARPIGMPPPGRMQHSRFSGEASGQQTPSGEAKAPSPLESALANVTQKVAALKPVRWLKSVVQGDELAMILHPPHKPFKTHMLQVSPLHHIYVEESGNPKGFPVIFLHGGPAAGLGDRYRQFFDPKFFHIIGFEQRGCGLSTPLAELRENTTWDLVEDIQKIRQALGIGDKKYLLFGGSWGSLLALAAAETHPKDVAGLIIRGISLGRPEDTAWSTRNGEGVYNRYPESGDYWAKVLELGDIDPEDIRQNRDPIMGVYDRLFNDPDVSEEKRLKALKYWSLGSTYVSGKSLATRDTEKPLAEYSENINTARIVCRYYYRNAFMNPPDQLLRDVDRLREIPYIYIVNGRQDLQTPPKRAHDLYKAMQQTGITQAKLQIVEEAAHSAWNPNITRPLMKALQEFQDLMEEQAPQSPGNNR